MEKETYLKYTHEYNGKINSIPWVVSPGETFFAFTIFSTVHHSRETQWVGQTLCAFRNRITARISHSARFSIFLPIFKYYKKSQNDRISASFTWLVTKRLLRPVNLEWCNMLTCASAMHKWSLLSG
jgi:hypothetical protein